LIELKLRIRAERKESRHESRAEINSFEDEDPKPVPRSLTEEGSVRGRSLQHLHHLPDQPGTKIGISCVCSLSTDKPGFFSQYFSSDNR
jgi:hypothetical protein